jgi:hypothetical protein
MAIAKNQSRYQNKDVHPAIDTYIEDAKYLYVRSVNADLNHPNYEKTELNNSEINKIFGYFKAVQALNSPQTDSIFNLYKVKIYHKYPLSSITLRAFNTKPGIENLLKGEIPTGNSALDKFFANYNFNKATYNRLGETGSTTITITTPKELNLPAVYRQLKGREEFWYNENPIMWGGDGDRIVLTYRGETAILSFFKGEGTCPAGCAFTKTWVFEITNGVAVYKGKSNTRPPNIFAATETGGTVVG